MGQHPTMTLPISRSEMPKSFQWRMTKHFHRRQTPWKTFSQASTTRSESFPTLAHLNNWSSCCKQTLPQTSPAEQTFTRWIFCTTTKSSGLRQMTWRTPVDWILLGMKIPRETGRFHSHHVTKLERLCVRSTTMTRPPRIFKSVSTRPRQTTFMVCTNSLVVSLSQAESHVLEVFATMNARCSQDMAQVTRAAALWQWEK